MVDRIGVIYQTQSVVLAAGASVRLTGYNRYVTILQATNTSQVQISFDGASFFPLPAAIGIDWEDPSFVYVKNNDSVSNTILVATGTANLRDNRLLIDSLNPVTVSISGNVASTVADGANVALGAKADAAATTDAGTFSLIGLFKRLLGKTFDKLSSLYSVDSLATTNAANIKATPGAILSLCAHNTTGAAKYIRLYDLAAAPTVGTDIPRIVVAVPANSSKEISFPRGNTYATGISVAITGAAAYNDATAVAAHDVQLSVNYQ